jgi:hypothetical protein
VDARQGFKACVVTGPGSGFDGGHWIKIQHNATA